MPFAKIGSIDGVAGGRIAINLRRTLTSMVDGTILAENPNRIYAILQNHNDVGTVYLVFGVPNEASPSQGILLYPHESVILEELTKDERCEWTGSVHGMTAAATLYVGVVEVEHA